MRAGRRCLTIGTAHYQSLVLPRSVYIMSAYKRPAASNDNDPSISPPLAKRKLLSIVTKDAVTNFFKTTSQKKDDPRVTWSERAADDDSLATLLVGRYDGNNDSETQPGKRRRVAAFDLDSTLITTVSGKKFANDPSDWKWWDSTVPAKLRSMHKDGYRVVILSNQNGLSLHHDPSAKVPASTKRVAHFKQKIGAVLARLDIPTSIYAATGKDIYRKPRTGMWREVCRDYNLEDVDTEGSIFVGDAGGRVAVPPSGAKKAVSKDFSCSDRNFAHNVSIKFQTPEEFFLGQQPREFLRDFDVLSWSHNGVEDVGFEKMNPKDIVLFCGPPGAGKSTFYWSFLEPLGYQRVNQDTLKSKDRCFRAAKDYLEEGHSVTIDNTNPDPDVRRQWVDIAKEAGVPIRCVWFKTPLPVAEHNDVFRALNKKMNPEARSALPKIAFTGFATRFKEPKSKEGFQDVVEVDFKFRGTKEKFETWGRYWL